MPPNRWLTAAGLVTWIASGLPAALAIAGGRLTGIAAVAWMAAFAAFGVAYSVVCFGRLRSVWAMRVLVLIQSLAGAAMVAVTRDGLAPATLVVAASQLVGLVPPGLSAAWVGAHTVAIVARYW